MNDIITAISTAPGNSGIGIVRLSGKGCSNIIRNIFIPKTQTEEKGYTIRLGNIIDENKNIIDEVLVSTFKKPKSYTGEDMYEINSHGNNIVLKKILELCIDNGARIAEAGEFTKRAFLNGRIDLSQAESVIDIINAKSDKERKAAINGLEGHLSNDINEIKKKILEILSLIEVSIDYPEYDVEEKENSEILNEANKIINTLNKLGNTFVEGKIIRDGISVALIGSPNAGKSSLLNAILREDKAIVTEIEGTTRDVIEEYITIKGILYKIIDTAGIRKTTNIIEKMGIEKSIKNMEMADLVVCIFDKTKDISKEEKDFVEKIKNKNMVFVINKCDLEKEEIDLDYLKKYKKPIVNISAKEKIGLEKLYDKMYEIFEKNNISAENANIITNIRHKKIIDEAISNMHEAVKTIKENMPIDISAIYFKETIKKLNEITGEDVSEEIINDIFSKFCLGK